MPPDEISLLYYDRCSQGVKRLHANTRAILQAANGMLVHVDQVNRALPFGDEQNMETLCTEGPLPYYGIVINGAAPLADEALLAAICGLEGLEMDVAKIIFLSLGNDPWDRSVTTIQMKSGDGYLTEHGAKRIVAYACKQASLRNDH